MRWILILKIWVERREVKLEKLMKMGKVKGSSIKTVTLTRESVCPTPTCDDGLGMSKTLRLRWFSRDCDSPVSPHSLRCLTNKYDSFIHSFQFNFMHYTPYNNINRDQIQLSPSSLTTNISSFSAFQIPILISSKTPCFWEIWITRFFFFFFSILFFHNILIITNFNVLKYIKKHLKY